MRSEYCKQLAVNHQPFNKYENEQKLFVKQIKILQAESSVLKTKLINDEKLNKGYEIQIKQSRERNIALLEENNILQTECIKYERDFNELKYMSSAKEENLLSQVASYKKLYEGVCERKRNSNMMGDRPCLTGRSKKCNIEGIEARVFDMKQKRKSIEYQKQISITSHESHYLNKILSPWNMRNHRHFSYVTPNIK